MLRNTGASNRKLGIAGGGRRTLLYRIAKLLLPLRWKTSLERAHVEEAPKERRSRSRGVIAWRCKEKARALVVTDGDRNESASRRQRVSYAQGGELG
jgi:hypothetical protein